MNSKNLRNLKKTVIYFKILFLKEIKIFKELHSLIDVCLENSNLKSLKN